MKHTNVYRKTVLLVAAVTALLLMATAVAVVSGHSGFKSRLESEGIDEVAGLVQEAHVSAAPEAEDGFEFSIDELLWEDDDLYISHSISVPEDGAYMVAMTTPTLNGEKLEYDAKNWAIPQFIDNGDHVGSALLVLGGAYDRSCNALWTFHVDPALKQRPDNRLAFRAVLLKYDPSIDIEASTQWTDMLNPACVLAFNEDWRDMSAEPVDTCDKDFVAMMDAAAEALGDGSLTVDELTSTGYFEYVTERTIDMGFDASSLPDAVYNDVAVHDFERFGMQIHINRFRMTHLGVYIDLTYSLPGTVVDDPESVDPETVRRLNDFYDLNWRFGTADGGALGYTLGGSGGGGWHPLEDGTPAYEISWSESAILPLEGIDRLIFAPCHYEGDESEHHAVYDMDSAIALTPVYSEEVAEAEANETPRPTISPEDLKAAENDISVAAK